MSVESYNLKQEIKEITSKCIKCGMCNNFCPVLRDIGKEQNSPRGMAIMLDQGYYEKIVYKCTLCKVCEDNCPVELKLCDAFQKARRLLVLQKKDPKENKEMINNLKNTGNPFGIKLNVVS
ncbi:4Fe-4S dicluster domain-containing protein [Candidatus Pacearchaeota archaeon]|nr:4Fe-4S dicluster domain-containing protein [Candidatus Pacearchaeota archaeon]